MAKKKVTPDAEFNELFDRVTSEINERDWEDIYNTDDFIKKIHEKYELNADRDAEIYKEMGERAHTNDFWVDDKGHEHEKPLIQEQLTKWVDKNIKEDDFLPEAEKQKIKERAKAVFTKKERAKFDELTASELQSGVSQIMQERLKGEKQDTDKVAKDEINLEKVKQTKPYQEAVERIKINRQVVKDVYESDAWRVKQYAERDLLKEVLTKFEKPSHIAAAARELYGTGKFTQARKPLELRAPQTIERDISALRLAAKGYTRYVKGGMILTKKGKNLMEKL